MSRESKQTSAYATSASVEKVAHQVITEQLHDERTVAVGLLGQRIELRDGVVKGSLGEVAGAVGRVQDFVVEYGEVQGQTEADGMGGRELALGDIGGGLQN